MFQVLVDFEIVIELHREQKTEPKSFSQTTFSVRLSLKQKISAILILLKWIAEQEFAFLKLKSQKLKNLKVGKNEIFRFLIKSQKFLCDGNRTNFDEFQPPILRQFSFFFQS